MTDAQIYLFMPQVAVIFSQMSNLPEETKIAMAANWSKPEAQAKEIEAIDDTFAAADTNNDGMLNRLEWAEFNNKQYHDRCAKYPDGWIPKLTPEKLILWFDLLVTLDTKEEVTLYGIKSSSIIIYACMAKIKIP